ncbi:unnamed protein product [Discula destructiva]
MARISILLASLFGLGQLQAVRAQDNPVVDPALDNNQLRATITQGLAELANSSVTQAQELDLAKLVNAFIGSRGNNNPGNVCPAAAIPFGVTLLGIDVSDAYAPPGYITNLEAPIRGLSLLHDSGTGSSLGSFGNFESMPVVCPGNDFSACPTTLDARKRQRMPGKDFASPGYFTLTLNNSIKMEAASTRRAGLVRYTFPASTLTGGLLPHIVQDWTNDAPGTFQGGTINFDRDAGRIQINGSWYSSFGPDTASYRAFACVDVLNGGQQTLDKTGLWQGNRYGQDTKLEGESYANLTQFYAATQAGALFSFSDYPKTQDGAASITLRVGVSYNSAAQACANAEEEIGTNWDLDATAADARAEWNSKLNRFRLDPATNSTIAELFYSSLYYSFLTPHNATGEAGNLFPGAAEQGYQGNYYDGLYCSWDSYRTFFPFLSLSSPREFAQISDAYVDGWRKEGWIPECRANLVPGYTQGGSHGVMIIADFVVKYQKEAEQLGFNLDDAYSAIFKDAFVTPEQWLTHGRQVGAYQEYQYVPFAVFDTYSNGLPTREASRTLEYAHNDFAARNVALLTGHPDVAATLANRSLTYGNTFDSSVTSLGFSTFVQKRLPNGVFVPSDPTTCSPIDNSSTPCSLQSDNPSGVYETSSWEYSFYAPFDVEGLISLLAPSSANSTTPTARRASFISRLDTYFAQNLFYAGNEPSFGTPWLYHYADAPAKTTRRVREVVLSNFNTTTAGLPGNSDVGAMQTLLAFHLLGLFPVVGTTELLVGSPFMPSFSIRNELRGTLVVVARGFDAASVAPAIPAGARAFVGSVAINGVVQASRCRVSFGDLFPGPGVTTTLTLEMVADEGAANGCGNGTGSLPSSLSTGGFAAASFL